MKGWHKMNLLERIEHTARKHGDRIAMRSRYGEITYQSLWERSGKLANYLSFELNSGAPVMIYGHKSPEMLTCFLACARSGHPYCPVDICMPDERVQSIAEQIGTPLVLAPDKFHPELSGEFHVLDSCDLDHVIRWSRTVAPTSSNRPEDIHYIIFTSGSTGQPKGVPITAANLENYLDWSRHLGTPEPHHEEIAEETVFLNQAPFSFDLSVMDLYNSLTVGGTLISVDKKLQQDIPAMLDYLAENPVEYWVSTPSFADLCLADPRFSAELLPQIRAFLFCGEVLTKDTASKLLRRFPSARVINTYGPTESTVCVTSVEITKKLIEKDGPLPVGLPKPGTEIQLDPDTDEIIIIGDTVSPGYFKNEEKSRAAFFNVVRNGQEVRAYRTGDKGHFDHIGMLYCDGRLDQQIKLHGYRIELGDIEASLLSIEGIRKAAVIPVKKDGKVTMLAACIVKETDSGIPDGYPGRKYIREKLREMLPGYMVPKRIEFITEIPLSVNGKIDRKRLERII